MHGTLDVVVFPKVYEETKDIWQPEKVVLVDGKVDTRGTSVNLLANEVHTEVTNVRPRRDSLSQLMASAPPPVPEEIVPFDEEESLDEEADEDLEPDAAPVVSDEPASTPDLGPHPLTYFDAPATPAPSPEGREDTESSEEDEALDNAESPVEDGTVAPTPVAPSHPAYREPVYVSHAAEKPHIVYTPSSDVTEAEYYYEIRVVIKRTGRTQEDIQHLRHVFQLLKRYHGRDKFYIIIPQNGGWVEIEYPNDRTGWCESLEAELRDLVGIERVQVRQIPLNESIDKGVDTHAAGH